MRQVIAAGLMLASVLSQIEGKKFRWCVLSDKEQRKCAEFSKALFAVLTPAAQRSYGKVSCVKAYSTLDCINKIRANLADAISVDAGDVYTATKSYGLTVVAKEIYPNGACIFAVAAVKDKTINIRKLKGLRSCHGGVRRTAGWNLPLGFLLFRNYLPWKEDQSLNEAINDYFSASCIPGIGATLPKLCSLCKGEKSYVMSKNHFCETTDNEPYFDSEGAFSCLRNGDADVAFLDHMAINNVTDESYMLLCPDGSQAPLTDFRNCNLGQGPGHAIVTRHTFRRIALKFLTVSQNLFGRQGTELQRFNLFDSAAYNGKNVLFRDATQKLLLLADEVDVNQILGLDYVALMKGLGHEGSSLDNSVVRWCCISAAELRKCEDWALRIKSDPLVCVRGVSATECIQKIKRDEADAMSLDASHAFIAGKCGLVAVAAEYYGENCSAIAAAGEAATQFQDKELEPVYAVVVAKKASRNVNIHNMAGRRSCHSYLYSPAGWLLLARYTIGDDRNDSCDFNQGYHSYFWKSCMPGSDGNLCKVCIGGEDEGSKATKRCTPNHNERYYGNMGSLRCLVGDVEGKSFGDVAFMEHYSLLQNIENLKLTGWASDWNPSDFELLCPDGSRVPHTEWKDCNLGAVPPNIIMTRPVITTKIYDFLIKSQETLQLHSDSEFQLFQSRRYGESDLLFKDATTCLVPAIHLGYKAILGETFMKMAEVAFNCTNSDILRFCNQDTCNSR
ncbi:melanotransferrin-like [Protopterus annectens]|uniref:melanotransferrin-like n=1 Tax=Protopterus annectens TaxID=7888 RepID=UPI001CF993D4|nr:melanotransferrin-like [Protopterus annectens]